MDGSESLRGDDFMQQLEFVIELQRNLFAIRPAAKIAVGEYSSQFTALTSSFLPASSLESLQNTTRDTVQSAELTFTASGILNVSTFFDDNGQGGNSVLVLLTDGRTTIEDQSNLAAARLALGARNIDAFFVGIGRSISTDELNMLAGGDTSRVITAADFDGLSGLNETLRDQIGDSCPDVTECTTTVTTTMTTSGTTSGTTTPCRVDKGK